MDASHAAARPMRAIMPLALPRDYPRQALRRTGQRTQDASITAVRRGLGYSGEGGLWRRFGQACLVPAVATGIWRKRLRKQTHKSTSVRATTVEREAEVAPWEVEEETEEERQARYKREAEEMKLKWDARRLEEKQSAERRVAFAQKERERAQIYGPRDPVMEAYEARMYEESRVIEVRRKQREVYERVKAFKLGRPLPPKGKEYVKLRPPPVQPPKPEDFDVSGSYDPQEDVIEAQYKAPEGYNSPSGPPPPARHERGTPKAAWEDPPYHPPSFNAQPSKWPQPGTDTSKDGVTTTNEYDEAEDEEEEEGEEKAGEPQEATDEGGFDEAELKSMKVSELKAKCSELGLPVAGTKSQLVARLLEG